MIIQKATSCSLEKAQLGLFNEPWNFEQTNSVHSRRKESNKKGLIKHTAWMPPLPTVKELGNPGVPSGGEALRRSGTQRLPEESCPNLPSYSFPIWCPNRSSFSSLTPPWTTRVASLRRLRDDQCMRCDEMRPVYELPLLPGQGLLIHHSILFSEFAGNFRIPLNTNLEAATIMLQEFRHSKKSVRHCLHSKPF